MRGLPPFLAVRNGEIDDTMTAVAGLNGVV